MPEPPIKEGADLTHNTSMGNGNTGGSYGSQSEVSGDTASSVVGGSYPQGTNEAGSYPVGTAPYGSSSQPGYGGYPMATGTGGGALPANSAIYPYSNATSDYRASGTGLPGAGSESLPYPEPTYGPVDTGGAGPIPTYDSGASTSSKNSKKPCSKGTGSASYGGGAVGTGGSNAIPTYGSGSGGEIPPYPTTNGGGSGGDSYPMGTGASYPMGTGNAGNGGYGDGGYGSGSTAGGMGPVETGGSESGYGSGSGSESGSEASGSGGAIPTGDSSGSYGNGTSGESSGGAAAAGAASCPPPTTVTITESVSVTVTVSAGNGGGGGGGSGGETGGNSGGAYPTYDSNLSYPNIGTGMGTGTGLGLPYSTGGPYGNDTIPTSTTPAGTGDAGGAGAYVTTQDNGAEGTGAPGGEGDVWDTFGPIPTTGGAY
ncbi:MAG: hypothetical protein Q9179_005774 [Wetmoreana sp. 5 TL-2023]